ncbi:MAG TPA: alpha/beta hydrolase [Bdellovibrionales bacterium]|nr:alpha/beta hydrolase [Pseudobdellovibrionaceae bacterium]HAG90666.1 alpha/beta hydrolase [Bdellovibrionales bacterium]|tara:strand:+ start:1508 stop:2326 length:819 start_codon:yes stop_codon:yes gene_type:complete
MADLSHFNYQISGNPEGHKLVFLHGLLGSLANWRRITSAFEDRFHILTYDQRGHGRSFQPETGYAPEDYAQDLEDILQELDWGKVHLVGHSMGGRNALEFAYRHPEQLHTLTVVDIGVEASKQAQDSILKLLSLVPRPFSSRKEARLFFSETYPELISYTQNPTALSQYFYSNMTEIEPGKVDWRFSLKGVEESLEKGRERDRWDRIQNLKVPTLYIRGELSEDLSAENFSKILGMNPLIQGQEIKGAGHWVHSDQPDSFIQVLNEFLTLHT